MLQNVCDQHRCSDLECQDLQTDTVPTELIYIYLLIIYYLAPNYVNITNIDLRSLMPKWCEQLDHTNTCTVKASKRKLQGSPGSKPIIKSKVTTSQSQKLLKNYLKSLKYFNYMLQRWQHIVSMVSLYLVYLLKGWMTRKWGTEISFFPQKPGNDKKAKQVSCQFHFFWPVLLTLESPSVCDNKTIKELRDICLVT